MKVVFVDDSDIVLFTLKSLVRELIETKHVECSFYNDSKVVKELLEQESLEYDLMFVDINMPVVSGYELSVCAKKISKYHYKPIIAITAEYTEESKRKGVESGVDGWFVKSIAHDNLQNSITEAIKQLNKGSLHESN